MWIDVRVPSEDAHRARALILTEHPHAWGVLEPSPPAAGPEAQLSFKGVDEAAVRELLEAMGISVLALRTRPSSEAPR